MGDPNSGYGRKQPGGWAYNILPFIEQQQIRDMGRGLSDPALAEALAVVHATPVAVFHCPSRRTTSAYPYVTDFGSGYEGFNNLKNLGSQPAEAARGDFAANGGSLGARAPEGPATLAIGYARTSFPDDQFNGVVSETSMVRLRDITDGTSYTYMVGGRNINPDHYYTGWDPADDNNYYTGCDLDVLRWTLYNETSNVGYLPLQDTPGTSTRHEFGSAHPFSFNMAFCDGSVHPISYAIEGRAHRDLGNREDGNTVDKRGL
jgi:prepilin-type processing-associated H-X9-DG protein